MSERLTVIVASDSQAPTIPDGPGGLGRTAHDIAEGLAMRGHRVSVLAIPNSRFDAGPLIHYNRISDLKCDVMLDCDHEHIFSKNLPNAAILNFVCDRFCPYNPPNSIVSTAYMQEHYPGARIVPTGVKLDVTQGFAERRGYLAFMASVVPIKNHEAAIRVAAAAKRELRIAGPNPLGIAIPNYEGPLVGETRIRFLAEADAFLAPYLYDASPRTPLEAASLGTPTLCLSGDGTRYHVRQGVSGFICANEEEMAKFVPAATGLDRSAMRSWIAGNHSFGIMIDHVERALYAVHRGERW